MVSVVRYLMGEQVAKSVSEPNGCWTGAESKNPTLPGSSCLRLFGRRQGQFRSAFPCLPCPSIPPKLNATMREIVHVQAGR